MYILDATTHITHTSTKETDVITVNSNPSGTEFAHTDWGAWRFTLPVL